MRRALRVSIVTAAISRLRSTSYSDARPRLEMQQLRGDLGRGVEAQRIGADQICLPFFQFLFAEPVRRQVPDFGRATANDLRARSFLVDVPP